MDGDTRLLVSGGGDEGYLGEEGERETVSGGSGYGAPGNVPRGIFQICSNRMWTYVCAEEWQFSNAAVACTELGYSSLGVYSVHTHTHTHTHKYKYMYIYMYVVHY